MILGFVLLKYEYISNMRYPNLHTHEESLIVTIQKSFEPAASFFLYSNNANNKTS